MVKNVRLYYQVVNYFHETRLKEDDVVVLCHQKKLKEYVEGKIWNLLLFPMEIENIFGESISFGSPISKQMKLLDFLLELFPRYQCNLLFTLTNA